MIFHSVTSAKTSSSSLTPPELTSFGRARCKTTHILCTISVADPGFPRGGGANSPGGAPTYNFAKFSPKLHEIERIWTPGGARPKFYYVDPPLNLLIRRIREVMINLISGKLLNT